MVSVSSLTVYVPPHWLQSVTASTRPSSVNRTVKRERSGGENGALPDGSSDMSCQVASLRSEGPVRSSSVHAATTSVPRISAATPVQARLFCHIVMRHLSIEQSLQGRCRPPGERKRAPRGPSPC